MRACLLETFAEADVMASLLALPFGEEDPSELWTTLHCLFDESTEPIIGAMLRCALSADAPADPSQAAPPSASSSSAEGQDQEPTESSAPEPLGPRRELVVRAFVQLSRKLSITHFADFRRVVFGTEAGKGLRDVVFEYACAQSTGLMKVRRGRRSPRRHQSPLHQAPFRKWT